MSDNNYVNPFTPVNRAGKTGPLDQYSNQPPAGDNDSPFYKPAAPAISLPKGGGAIKGIDEKFSVNALNGTAGMDIPLPLSPGRGGFSPSLSLSYNSGSGNSEFGLGWGLSLPSIQRKTDKKLPRYNDEAESDVFLLAGAEDMVPELDGNGNVIVTASGDYTIKRYRPRIEGLFARIEYISKTGITGGWWRVTTKDNITTYYGLDTTGRITDPGYAYRIYKWLPQLVLDHKGNVQQYEYIAEDSRGVNPMVQEKNRLNGTAKYTNTYLKRVRYCNEVPYFIDETDCYEPAFPGSVNYLMEAVLDYGDHSTPFDPAPDRDWPCRSDAFSAYQAGFEIRTYRLCRNILMYHHFAELDGHDLVRSLELTYKQDGLAPGILREVDYILSATQRGHEYKDGAWRNKALPAMTFDYEPLVWNNNLTSVGKEDFSGAPQGLTGPYQWTDFEGEGISGIMTEQGSGWFYKNNLGDGHFTSPRTIAQKPSFNGLSNGGLQWQDLDADGRRQVVSENPVKGFWELDDDQRWQPFRTFAKNGNIDLDSPFTKMIDLNGDGKADILVTEDRAWTWWENLGKEGFDTGGSAPIFHDEEKGPVLLLRDPVQSIFLADMSGDGMTDLVRIRNGETCYWPNMGYGRFGAKVTMGNAPTFHSPDQYNPEYLTLADISGTGAADLIYLGKGNCSVWVNLSGNGFGEKQVIGYLPSTDQYSKIAVLDFLGNGTGCIVWSSPLPQYITAPLRYMDLMGGKKPYLMRSYNNGMGKAVAVTYKSSTQYYLADKLAGKPWATKLPFPVHCINSITRHSDNAELQDLRYWYDPVGNITLQQDGAQQPVYFNGSVADPENNYTYDALYRLIQTAGREHAGNNTAPDYSDSSRSGFSPVPIAATDTAKMRRYIQYYQYDAVGNFIQMRHTVTGGTGNWTRYYTTDANSNRLAGTVVGSGTPETYTYDNRGNITGGFAHLQTMTYNASNRLEQVVLDSSRTAYYQYDSSGQRVRKTIVIAGTGVSESRRYVGDWEVYRKFGASSSLILERETLHISDDTGRLALIDTRTTGSGTEPAQLMRYQYSNHLGSAMLELDDAGAIISYEEYYPYGSTSFSSGRSGAEVSLKRYRYTGKERDEESGLYYHGARYYLPWLARWCSPDPINSEWYNIEMGNPGRNLERNFTELCATPYEYCYDSPAVYDDPGGEQPPVKNLPIIDPSAVRELTENLPKGGEQISKEFAKELAEKSAGKVAEKTALKTLVKAGAKLNVIADVIQLVLGSADMIKGAGAQPSAYHKMMKERIEAEQKEYEKAHPPQKITTDVSKLTEGDKKEIANRITTGKATPQDLIYASQLDFVGTNRLDMGGGRIFQHFTNAEGIMGITGISSKQLGNLKIGEE